MGHWKYENPIVPADTSGLRRYGVKQSNALSQQVYPRVFPFSDGPSVFCGTREPCMSLRTKNRATRTLSELGLGLSSQALLACPASGSRFELQFSKTNTHFQGAGEKII